MERTTLTERLHQAEAEIKAGRPEQALAVCQELQTAYPRALRVQRVLGEIYLALRKPREALAALDRALAGDPEDVRACCARALVHQIHGDNISALAWYGRACDLRPDDQALRVTYRDLARRLDQPSYRPSRAGLARLYLRGDLFAHAIREWEQLVIENPDMLDAQVGLAETLWIAGHARAAEERSLRILANSPSCVKAMLILMALALADGDMDSARSHLERTLQLDPDMAIAQVLFADALASGDPIFTALLRPNAPNPGNDSADETMKLGRTTAGFAQSGPLAGQRNVSRPLVTSAPVVEPAFGAAQPSSQPLPPPPRPDVPVASQPTEVTRAIKETAFMIWGQDDDSQPRLAAQGSNTTGDGDIAGPPVLRELGASLEDSETQRALNWYNWLQAQGAVALGASASSPAPTAPPPERPHGITVPIPEAGGQAGTLQTPMGAADASNNAPPDRRTGSPRLTVPIPPTRSTMPIPPAPPIIPAMPPMPAAPFDDEPATAPLPLPTPEALRTMFAELGGDTVVQPAVQPSVVSGTMPPAANLPANLPLPAVEPPVAEAPSSAVNEARDEQYAHRTDPRAHDEGVAPTSASEQSEHEQPSPQTIEELERQFAASGFTPVEARPGLLAEIQREQHTGNGATPHPQDAVSESSPATPAASEPNDSAPPVPVVSEPKVAEPKSVEPRNTGPDPRDYPGRLAHARQRRGNGQIDDALNEYRVIIKNAPDLLQEVLSDLRASLDEMPDHPNLHSVMGDALVCQGEYEAALESYNKATELAQARSGRS